MYQAEDIREEDVADFTVTVVDERAESSSRNVKAPGNLCSDEEDNDCGSTADDESVEECPRLFSVLDLARVAGRTMRDLTDAGRSLLSNMFSNHFSQRPPLLLTWHQDERPTKIQESPSIKLLPYQRLRRTPRADNELHQLATSMPLQFDEDGELLSKKMKVECCHDDADTIPPALKKQRREESRPTLSPLRSPLRCGSAFLFSDGGELAAEPARQKRQREIASN